MTTWEFFLTAKATIIKWKAGSLSTILTENEKGMQRLIRNGLLASLEQFYRDLCERTGRLEKLHGERLHCSKGCHSCCKDGITVFKIEAENIRRNHEELLKKKSPHEMGKCAFLDNEGACRIYEDRPYVCRTQGYPLRWIEDSADGTIVEMRDICPLNEGGKPIMEISEEDCWTIGPFEEELRRLQSSADGGKLNRVSLRDLFKKRG